MNLQQIEAVFAAVAELAVTSPADLPQKASAGRTAELVLTADGIMTQS